MSHGQHPLIAEYPALAERMQKLKRGDGHFARLFDEYHELDHQVMRAETGLDHLGDLALETLKVRRVKLKDELFDRLNQVSTGCCGSCGGH